MWRTRYPIGDLTSKSALLPFNLILSARPPSPPPTTKPHPQDRDTCHRIPYFYYFHCFCGIRRYFVQILIVSAHGGATALNRLSRKTIFCTDPHCVSSWSSYSLKQAFPWKFFLFVYINLMSSCSLKL